MKRFYCKVCKKVKRVQKLPVSIESPAAESPLDRVGSCNYHFTGRNRPVSKSVVKRIKIVTDTPVKTSKKARKSGGQ